MTVTQLIISVLILPCLGGAGYTAKLVGDTLWLPISSYQQEKLYDLEDQRDDYTDKEEFDGELSEFEKRKLKRLKKQIQRLTQELQ